MLLLLASPAAGGDSALEPPDLSRYLRWGPLRARPGIELSNIGYDDNILSSDSDRVSDYTATAYGKLDGLVLFGSRAFLTFDERLGQQLYLENSGQNFPVQRGNARVTFPFEQLGVFAETRLVRDTERPIDRQDVRADRAEDLLGAGLILEPGWRTSVELSTSTTRWRYSDPDATSLGGETVSQQLDRDERYNRLRARYRWRGRTSFQLDARDGAIDFASLDLAGRSKESEARGLRGGIELEAGGPLTGGATIGWERIDAGDPARADFGGMVGQIDLAYRPWQRTTFRLEAERAPGFAITGDSTYYLATRANLTVVYSLNRIVGLEVGGGLGTLAFSGAGGATRRDDIEREQLALRLRLAENSIGRKIEYRVELQRYEHDSPQPGANLTRTTLGVSAALGF